MKVYHQCGHNQSWNIDMYLKEQVGDGLILGPRYMNKDKVLKLSSDVRRNSIFDPQFFLPSSARGELDSFEFFPSKASDGFNTISYADDYALESARNCIRFQDEIESSFIIIPTRYYEGTPDNFISEQTELFIKPFLKEIDKSGAEKKVLLQLVINNLMFKNEEFISDILNWVTGLKIDGVYLIPANSFTTKQIKETGFLYSVMNFVHAIKQNGLMCVIGYTNLESILYSFVDPDIITMGSYENLRSFTSKAFEKKDEKDRQYGPNPRLYISKLLQLVESGYLDSLKIAYPKYSEIFDINKYQAEMFTPTFNWHFSKPEIYKHFFLEFDNQIQSNYDPDIRVRFSNLKNLFESAISMHEELVDKGIILDSNSDGSHINVWLTTLNLFANKIGVV